MKNYQKKFREYCKNNNAGPDDAGPDYLMENKIEDMLEKITNEKIVDEDDSKIIVLIDKIYQNILKKIFIN